MRIVLSLLAATLLVMVIGAASTLANEAESPDAPSGSSINIDEAQSDIEMAGELVPNVEEILEEESENFAEETVQEDEMAPELSEEWVARIENEVIGKIDLDHLWADAAPNASLLYRLSVAVLRSRTVPAGKDKPRAVFWQKCGVEVPKEEVIRQAGEWVALFLSAMEDVEKKSGVAMPVWGVFAAHANEGGFDPCALDYPTRKWASESNEKRLIVETWKGNTTRRKVMKKLVEKFQLSYDRETVWTILHDSYYPSAKTTMPNGKAVTIGGKSDIGPWQLRTSVKKLSRSRFDKQTSMIPGIYMGVKEMARRAMQYSYRYRIKEPHPRPWMLWPGWNPYTSRALLYDSKVTSVARWLGARKNEIERGFVVVDTSRKKPRYRVENR
jgi:hypothetical protein